VDDDPARQDALADVIGHLGALSAVRRRLWRQLPHGLGGGSAVLHALADCGEARLGDLASYLDLDLSAVSRQVAQLEARGAVRRRVNPADRRSSLVRLSGHGRDLLAALARANADRVAAATAGWPREDLAALALLLGRLQGALTAPETCHPTRTTSRTPSRIAAGPTKEARKETT
jgi:DNA-binding MarR family transcriptional regulator